MGLAGLKQGNGYMSEPSIPRRGPVCRYKCGSLPGYRKLIQPGNLKAGRKQEEKETKDSGTSILRGQQDEGPARVLKRKGSKK